jgi:hypothetical protein
MLTSHKIKLRWRGTAETGRKKDLILASLTEGKSLYSICLDARISQCQVSKWRKTDTVFRAACSKAMQVSTDLRAQARDRVKRERRAEQERRLAMWRREPPKWKPINRIAP